MGPWALLATAWANLEWYTQVTQRNSETETDPARHVFTIGYSGCTDLNVQSSDFIAAVASKFNVTDARPKHHTDLRDARALVESFLYSFQKGSNAELRVDGEFFPKLVNIARATPSIKVYAGGNALVMAHRIAKEETAAEVRLGAQVDEDVRQKLERRRIRLLSPSQDDRMDVHLAVEYVKSREHFGIRAPRSNRFYMNADIDNTELTAAQGLHEILHPDDFFVLSGLQLVKPSSLSVLSTVAAALKAHNGPSHFESGSYEDPEVFTAVWSSGIFLAVRSLGLNEQELAHLDFVATHDGASEGAPKSSDSNPGPQAVLHQMLRTARKMRLLGARLSRLHVHALSFHLVCYDPQRWSDGRPAVAAGSRVTSELSCGDAWGDSQWGAFEPLPRIPLEELADDGLRCGPVVDGDLSVHCCIAPVLVCKSPVRTAGLGDNISAAGLAHHRYLFPDAEEDGERNEL